MDPLKRLLEIRKRKAELNAQLRSLKDDELENAIKEVDDLNNEEIELNKRMAEADDVEKRGQAIIKPVEKKQPQAEQRTIEQIIASEEYRSAYLKNLQGKDLLVEERATLTTATNSVGAVVPTITMNKIIEKLEQQGVIFPHVTPLNIPSNVKIPVEGETEECSWVNEGASTTDSNDKIGGLELGARELIKTLEITAHVEAMSIDAFESFIIALLVRKVRKAIDYAIINGNGTTQAKGILGTLGSDILETEGTKWTYDDVITLKRSLKSGYYQNAQFIMSSTTLGMVEKIKDKNGTPLFKEESDKGFPTLSNKRILYYDNMPDGTILFGDLTYYFFNFVKAFEIAKDKSVGFKSGKTCYRALGLCDGKLALKEAFAGMELKDSSSGSGSGS